MSKVVISLAEKLALLRAIPPQMIPSTLKYKINLPKLTEMKFEYARRAKQFGPTFAYYRKYIADIRLHNPNLKIYRQVTQNGPLVARIVLQGQPGTDPVIIQGIKSKSVDELKAKILEAHNEM